MTRSANVSSRRLLLGRLNRLETKPTGPPAAYRRASLRTCRVMRPSRLGARTSFRSPSTTAWMHFIPVHGGQGFQNNVDTDSSGTRTGFRRDRGQNLECDGIAVMMPCGHGGQDNSDEKAPTGARTIRRARETEN